MHSRLLALPALTLMAGLACTKPAIPPSQGVQVTVTSDPEKAVITLAGKPLGPAPQALTVASAEELLALHATHGGDQAVEKRIRFLSMNRAEVSFTFGAGRSTMGKVLNLPKVLVFDYGAGVTFDVNKASLKAEFLPLLNRQSGLLQTHFPNLDVYVCGHTDSTGAKDRNQTLSVERARSVAEDLATRGVPRTRLKVQGFGPDYPLAPNDTDGGRAMNRRTEVILPQ